MGLPPFMETRHVVFFIVACSGFMLVFDVCLLLLMFFSDGGSGDCFMLTITLACCFFVLLFFNMLVLFGLFICCFVLTSGSFPQLPRLMFV